MKRLDEEGLKCQLLSKFRRERVIGTSSTLASEYVLGQTGRRSDLAVWNGTMFIGIEVKSSRDTLARLPDQQQAYLKFFDNVIVVCDEIHARRVESICHNVVGIYVWKKHYLEALREPSVNRLIDRDAFVKALSARQLNACFGLSTSTPVKRPELETRLAADRAVDVQALVIESFQANYAATSTKFWNEVARKRIRPDHLLHLSRFAPYRAEEKEYREAKEQFWQHWHQQAHRVFR